MSDSHRDYTGDQPVRVTQTTPGKTTLRIKVSSVKSVTLHLRDRKRGRNADTN